MRLEHVPCNLCGGDETSLLFSQADSLTAEPTEFSVVRCRGCGLDYVNPRPSAADIHHFYPPEFVSYQFEISGPGASFRQKLVSAVTRSSARQRAKVLQEAVRLDSRTRVLDVGCGKGVFLYALREKHGCDVMGVDFDPDAVRYCREQLGINAAEGGITDLAGRLPRFDVITMWHFLEHDLDPLAALRIAYDLLADGGLLVVEVPNAHSAENALFGKRSYLYDLPRHLYHFSPVTLGALLERAGFQAGKPVFTCLAGGWIGSIQGVFTRGRVYRRLKENVYLFLLLAQLAMPLDFISALCGRGSIITMSSRKRALATGK